MRDREKASQFTLDEHQAVMHRECRRNGIGCGGRVFWGKAEPRFFDQLGYEGTCSWCGWMTYTLDALLMTQPVVTVGKRVPHRRAA